MSGPHHFKAAEELLEVIDEYSTDDLADNPLAMVAIAQVHAVLALAAASALQVICTSGDREGWRDAVSINRQDGAE